METSKPGLAPSPEEIREAAKVLSRLQPGILPRELFIQITRLWVTSIVEVVPLRRGEKGNIEVLLLQRPDDDPIWPAMQHTPGTVVRPTDVGDGMGAPFERILTDELGLSPEETLQPRFVTIDFHKIARGTEVAQIFTIDLTGYNTPIGVWYSIDSLPDDLIDTQRPFIMLAMKEFTQGDASHGQ